MVATTLDQKPSNQRGSHSSVRVPSSPATGMNLAGTNQQHNVVGSSRGAPGAMFQSAEDLSPRDGGMGMAQRFPSGDSSRLIPSSTSEDYYFSRFFRREINAAELVEVFARLADCPANTPEADLLARMLKVLFTECRHFPKYPPAELAMTGHFFGKLIRSEILLRRPELQLLAIRCVMEALRIDTSTAIFRFGLIALAEFLAIAPTSPTFLAYLPRIMGLQQHFPSLVRWAESCLALLPPQARSASLLDMTTVLKTIAPNVFPRTDDVLIIPPAFQLLQSAAPPSTASTGLGFNDALFSSSGPNNVTPFGSVPVPEGRNVDGKYVVSITGFGLGQVEALLNDSDITNQIIEPPESLKLRVGQIFNSLVKLNLKQKANELLQVFEQTALAHPSASGGLEWFPWLCFYVVKVRASKEPNHHVIYYEFSLSLGHSKIIEMLTNVTYDAINVLLKYVVSASPESSYRQMLRSLGSWLGLLTLANNRPIRSKSFDIKHLLFDAFERGVLLAVVPLVCSVLEHMKASRIFKLPNPWVVSNLSCLGALYSIPDIKQSLQFEIELLMQNLGLQIEQFVSPTTNLFLNLVPPANSPDLTHPTNDAHDRIEASDPDMLGQQTSVFSNPNLSQQNTARSRGRLQGSIVGQKQMDAQNNAFYQAPNALNRNGPAPVGSSAVSSPSNRQPQPSPLLAALTANVVISRSLALFQHHPHLKDTVPLAIERAVRQVIAAVSERAIALAVSTSCELVLKDFCFESDETLVKRAAHLMSASLGASIVSTLR